MATKSSEAVSTERDLSLRARVETRKCELERALSRLGPRDRGRRDIETALNDVRELLTGDLDQIPYVVAAELSNWLETNKHVNERYSDGNVDSDT